MFVVKPCVIQRYDADVDDQDVDARDKDIMEEIHPLIRRMSLPPLTLASGRTTLRDKLFVVMFDLFLVAGKTWASFVYAVRAVAGNTADFGVEYGLNLVKPVPVRQLFPWAIDDAPSEDRTHEADDDFEVAEQPPSALDEAVSMEESLSSSGVLHVLHNAADNVLKNMPLVEEAVDGLSEVCDLFSGTHTRPRVLATCFRDPVSRELGVGVAKFKARMYCETA